MTQEPQPFRQRVRATLAQRQRRTLDDPALTCAAVLIPLLFDGDEWCVLVTQRTQTVVHHKGQISFPGGACEPDDESLLATALRETYEEIGVPSDAVEVLGALDDYGTITDFVVTPFVGVIPHPFAYHLNHGEVAAAIEVPLSFLGDPTNLRTEQREHKGRIYSVLFWDFGPHTIWGATAQMLKDFLDLVTSEHLLQQS